MSKIMSLSKNEPTTSNTNESTPKNSINAENQTHKSKLVAHRLPKIADYIEIDYDDLGS